MTVRANPLPRAAVVLADLPAIVALFHTATGTAYANLMIDGHRESWYSVSTAVDGVYPLRPGGS